MHERPTTRLNGHENGKLTPLEPSKQGEVLRQWSRTESGMEGARGLLPDKPDDPVAYKLLDAAGDAISRGDWQRGSHILQLVARDYRQSQEAACARTVLDRFAEKAQGRGR